MIEDYKLGGEVLAEFKMKNWGVTIRLLDGADHPLKVDPYHTAGDLISQLTAKFSLPTTEECAPRSARHLADRRSLTLPRRPDTACSPSVRPRPTRAPG